MTEYSHSSPTQPTLSLSFAEVGRIRVRPAELARMLNVSRQTVSQWIQVGKVTLGADGKLDPTVATRQVIENSDPSRLRARVLKSAVDDVGALRRRIAELEHSLAAALERSNFLEGFSQAQDRADQFFIGMVIDQFADLVACSDDLTRRQLLDSLFERATFLADGLDPDDPQDGLLATHTLPEEGVGTSCEG